MGRTSGRIKLTSLPATYVGREALSNTPLVHFSALAVVADAAPQGNGIAHVVHGSLQPHTHHAALLAHSLKGGSQFYLTLVVVLGIAGLRLLILS